MQKEVLEAFVSSVKEDFETPQLFFDELNKKYNFVLDLAANERNHKCDLYLSDIFDTALFDFLIIAPGSAVFINPPYGRKIKKFIERAIQIANHFKLVLVMLLPSRTDTKWFSLIWDRQNNCPSPGFQVDFKEGRLIFEIDGKPVINKKTGKQSGALFPSMLVVYDSFNRFNF